MRGAAWRPSWAGWGVYAYAYAYAYVRSHQAAAGIADPDLAAMLDPILFEPQWIQIKQRKMKSKNNKQYFSND